MVAITPAFLTEKEGLLEMRDYLRSVRNYTKLKGPVIIVLL